MAYQEVLRVDISEVIRRWQAGNSWRHIASGTGLSKDTVGKYISAAEVLGIARDGSGPGEEQLSRLAAISRSGPRQAAAPSEELLAPWSDQIYQWLTSDRLQVTRIQELLAERNCRISYSSRYRWLSRRHWQRRSASTVRMGESVPGEVAELDFGRLGFIQDQETGRRCAVWALLVVLAYSRHSFVWPTYSQKLDEVIAGPEAAWAFFGGIPGRRCAIPPPDPWLPGIFPAPGLHHRPRPGAPPQGQAQGGAGRPVRQGTLLQVRGVPGPAPPPFRSGSLVP